MFESCVVGRYALQTTIVPRLWGCSKFPSDSSFGQRLGVRLERPRLTPDNAAACDTGRCNAATLHAEQRGSTRRDPRAPAATRYTSQLHAPTGDHGPVGIRWGRRLVRDKDGSLKAARSTKATQVQVHRGTVFP